MKATRSLRPAPCVTGTGECRLDSPRRRSRYTRIAGSFVVILALASCDFEVTNPGPVQDVNLDDPGAHKPLVTAAMSKVLMGLGDFGHRGSAIVRDHTTGGQTGDGGIPLDQELGQLSELVTSTNGWDRTHQGRWIAEESIRRIRENMGSEADAYPLLAELHLWAGFGNRVLGEHVCHAVIDGGAAEPYTNHFTRAVEHFTNAETIAAATGQEEVRLASIAGRAAARTFLDQWTEAAADASKVPFDFEFEGRYKDRGCSFCEGDRYRISEAVRPGYRGISYWHTAVEDYFPATGDSRVAWGHDPNHATATIPRVSWGRFIPFYYPVKLLLPRHADELTVYAPDPVLMDNSGGPPVNLATGREMALIRAEAALAQGQAAGIAEAMGLINQVRQSTPNYFTGEPLPPLPTPSTVDEAWAVLKFERFVELALEGRRFGDRKRWAAADTPGALHPLEYLPDEIAARYGVPREVDLCFPIPRAEKEANANIPVGFEDTKVSDRG